MNCTKSRTSVPWGLLLLILALALAYMILPTLLFGPE
jgi:hypothetical protein